MSDYTPPTPEEREERRRLMALPFRMIVEDVFEIKARGIGVTGRIEAGTLQQGNSILIKDEHISIQATIGLFMMFIRSDPAEFVAEAGDNVGFVLRDLDESYKEKIKPGMIITKQGES